MIIYNLNNSLIKKEIIDFIRAFWDKYSHDSADGNLFLESGPNVYNFIIKHFNTTDLNNLDLSGIDFTGANLQFLNFSSTNLQGCTFDGASLFRTNLTGAVTDNKTSFKNARLIFTNLSEMIIDNVSFEGSIMHGCILIGTRLRNVNMNEIDAFETNFNNANLVRCSFSASKLIKAEFHNSKIENSTFYNATLIGSNYYNARIHTTDFSNTDASKTIFDYSNLEKVDFTNTTLEEASAQNIICKNVSFYRANLKSVNFNGARSETAKSYMRTLISTFKGFISDCWLFINMHPVLMYGISPLEFRDNYYYHKTITFPDLLQSATNLNGTQFLGLLCTDTEKEWLEKRNVILNYPDTNTQFSIKNLISKTSFFDLYHKNVWRKNNISSLKIEKEENNTSQISQNSI